MTRRFGTAIGAIGVLALVVGLVARPAAVAESEDPVVLPPVARDEGPAQDPAQVAARLAPLTADAKKLGKLSATRVVDSGDGTALFDDEGSIPVIPASTNKIPTSVAALEYLGADRTLKTRVVRSGNDVVLIGGGDPLLVSRAEPKEPGYPVYPKPTSLRTLAGATAKALTAAGVTATALKVDDSLFDGPAWNPAWPEYFRTQGIVAPVSALMVDDGRVGNGEWAPIGPDPAMAAGEIFAQMLKSRGITVSDVQRGKAGEGAQELAQVESAPVYQLIAQALTTSDNQTAENLFRLAGSAGGFGGSFAGGGQAVTKSLDQLGLGTTMLRFDDGSGLSRENRLTADLLTEILRRAVRGEEGLWPISSGLAVAGVQGTLRGRFLTPETSGAAGWVRGKTGTLNYVSSLAGFMQSRSGRVLVFASISNEATSSFDAATQIDKIVAAAADCGCPGAGR